jgi:hypothetical protein
MRQIYRSRGISLSQIHRPRDMSLAMRQVVRRARSPMARAAAAAAAAAAPLQVVVVGGATNRARAVDKAGSRLLLNVSSLQIYPFIHSFTYPLLNPTHMPCTDAFSTPRLRRLSCATIYASPYPSIPIRSPAPAPTHPCTHPSLHEWSRTPLLILSPYCGPEHCPLARRSPRPPSG